MESTCKTCINNDDGLCDRKGILVEDEGWLKSTVGHIWTRRMEDSIDAAEIRPIRSCIRL